MQTPTPTANTSSQADTTAEQQVGALAVTFDFGDLRRAVDEALRVLLPALEALEPVSEEAAGQVIRLLADRIVTQSLQQSTGAAGGAAAGQPAQHTPVPWHWVGNSLAPQHRSPENMPPRLPHTLELQPAFQHHGDQSVTVHDATPHNPPQRISGRCCLYINAGSATIRLNPTPAEMRALAALLTAAADTEGAQ